MKNLIASISIDADFILCISTMDMAESAATRQHLTFSFFYRG